MRTTRSRRLLQHNRSSLIFRTYPTIYSVEQMRDPRGHEGGVSSAVGYVRRQWPSGTAPAFTESSSGLHQSGRRAFDSRLTPVESPILCMLESPARRSFKKIAGQNNHFLITIHVGLAAVETGNADLPHDMRVSWDPHNRGNSSARSRGFANKAALAWLVDGLDTYTRTLKNKPVIASQQIRDDLEEAERNREGISGKIRVLATATSQINTAEAELVEIAIGWRNRLVHQSAGNKIRKSLATAVRDHSGHYAETYQGLLINELISHVEQKPAVPPTLKEITAVIRASHKLIERVDSSLLCELDAPGYLDEVLYQHLTADVESNRKIVMARAGKIWGKSPSRRRSAIMQIAYNNGFSEYLTGASGCITEVVLDGLVQLSPLEAVRKLAPRFIQSA
jgi:hypothetical protein